MPDTYKILESYTFSGGDKRESTIAEESAGKQEVKTHGASRRHDGGTEAAETESLLKLPAEVPLVPCPVECDSCGEWPASRCCGRCVRCGVVFYEPGTGGSLRQHLFDRRHPENPASCRGCYEAHAVDAAAMMHDPATLAALEVDPADPMDPDARSIAGMGLEHGWDRSCHQDIVTMLVDTDPAGLHHYAAGLGLAWFLRTFGSLTGAAVTIGNTRPAAREVLLAEAGRAMMAHAGRPGFAAKAARYARLLGGMPGWQARVAAREWLVACVAADRASVNAQAAGVCA